MDRAAVLTGMLTLAAASAVLASDKWEEGVVVRAHGSVPGGSLDDRAIFACAKSMMRTMFPGAKQVRVFTASGEQIFSDADDNVLPGYEMSVSLKATDLKTGKTLGTAECDVTPAAKVTSLRPGARVLQPNAGVATTG